MALSFGLGLSTSIRDARERQSKKRLENKKTFDKWLSDKRERGESVKAEDLENEKFTITGGDSLYSDWIGNEAAMESMTTRHNEKVTSDLITEQTQNIKNKTAQETLLYDRIGLHDTYESFKKNLADLLSPNGKNQKLVDERLLGMGLFGDEGRDKFDRLQDKKWQAEIQRQMTGEGASMWAKLGSEEQVKNHFSSFPPKFIAKAVETWKAQEKRIRDTQVSKAIEQVLQNVKDLTHEDLANMSDEDIETMVRGQLIIQPSINPGDVTDEMISNGVAQFNAKKNVSKKVRWHGISQSISKAFYDTPTLANLLKDGTNFASPSNETLANAISQAIAGSGVPEWAIKEYLQGGQILDSTTTTGFAKWVTTLFGPHFQTELSKKLYQNSFEQKYDEGKLEAGPAVEAKEKENIAVVLDTARLNPNYAETFYSDDGKTEKPGMLVLQQLLKRYYIPSGQADAVLSKIHAQLQDKEISNYQMVGDTIAQNMNLQSLGDWRSNFKATYTNVGGTLLKPNTDLKLHTFATVEIVEKQITKVLKQLAELPTTSKDGDLWLVGKGYLQIRDALLQNLEMIKGRIIKQYQGEQVFAFTSSTSNMNVINTEYNVDFNPEGEELNGVGDIGNALIKYIEDTIADIKDDNGVLHSTEPSGVDNHTEQLTHKAFKVPIAQVMSNSEKFGSLKMNGGDEPLIKFTTKTTGGYAFGEGELNPAWTNGDTPVPNEEFKKLFMPNIIEVLTEMNKFTPYITNDYNSITSYKKALKALLLFNMTDEEAAENHYGYEVKAKSGENIRLTKEDIQFLTSNHIGGKWELDSADLFGKIGTGDLVGSRGVGKKLDKFLEHLVLVGMTNVKRNNAKE